MTTDTFCANLIGLSTVKSIIFTEKHKILAIPLNVTNNYLNILALIVDFVNFKSTFNLSPKKGGQLE